MTLWERGALIRLKELLCDCGTVLYIVNGVPSDAIWLEYRKTFPRESVLAPVLQEPFGREIRPKERKFLDSIIRYVVD